MQDMADRRVTVAGLGHFGGQIAAARWLVAQGAKVLITDREPAEKLSASVRQLDGLSIQWRLGEHREEDFTSTDLIVASPAIPPANSYLQAARAAGVLITTEICLFVERCPATIIGVTGTKGKSTTASMLGRMLGRRYRVHVGGNIGAPLIEDVARMDKTDVVVLELSSFMLHYLGGMKWSPHVGVVTLIAPDHLEWHGSFDAYLGDKTNLLRFQRPGDFAVVNGESDAAIGMATLSAGKVIRYGVEGREPFDLRLPGRHNQLNAQGAFAAAELLGVTWGEAQASLLDFAGLAHRLHLVHEADGVRYFDDSIATVPEAAIAALESFPPRKVLQIVGGSGKKRLPMDLLARALVSRAKCALCIGETGPAIAELMRQSEGLTLPPIHPCGDMATAVQRAKEIAEPGDIVLLSTGCASQDQFVNFEERGRAFTALARGQADESGKGEFAANR